MAEEMSIGGDMLMQSPDINDAIDDAAGLQIQQTFYVNPYRYCGEYCDDETGYVYLRARYYDPCLGRFISEDTAKDGYNWYVYCGNDPVNRVDPSGCFWNVVIGAVVGTVTGAIAAAMSGENIWAGAASGLIAGTICGLTLGIGSAIALAGGAANTMIGLTLAAAGGFAGSFIGESARQLGNYGCINDWGKAFDEGISGAVANTAAFGVGNCLSSGFPKKEAVKNVKGEIAVFKTMAKTFITQSAAETMANFYFSMFLVAPLQYSISLTLSTIGGDR